MNSLHKNFTIILLVFAVVLSGTAVFAQTSDYELPDPGMLPGHPFYFVKSWSEAIGTFFTFGDEVKAERHSHLAEKRIAEIHALAERGDDNRVRQTLERYNFHLNEAIQRAERVQAEEIVSRIAEKTLHHENVLINVVTQTPEEARQAVERAIEVSRTGHERALNALSEEKKVEVENRLHPIRERIQERLQPEIKEETISTESAEPPLDPQQERQKPQEYTAEPIERQETESRIQREEQRLVEEQKQQPETEESGQENNYAPTFGEAIEIAQLVEKETGAKPALLLAILQKWVAYKRDIGAGECDIPREWELYSDETINICNFKDQVFLLGLCLEAQQGSVEECFSAPPEPYGFEHHFNPDIIIELTEKFEEQIDNLQSEAEKIEKEKLEQEEDYPKQEIKERQDSDRQQEVNETEEKGEQKEEGREFTTYSGSEFGGKLHDYFPVITSFSADPYPSTLLSVGDEIFLKVEAYEPEDRQILYQWWSYTSGGGGLSEVYDRWTTNNEIRYRVTSEDREMAGENFRVGVYIKSEKEHYRTGSHGYDDGIYIDYKFLFE